MAPLPENLMSFHLQVLLCVGCSADSPKLPSISSGQPTPLMPQPNLSAVHLLEKLGLKNISRKPPHRWVTHEFKFSIWPCPHGNRFCLLFLKFVVDVLSI